MKNTKRRFKLQWQMMLILLLLTLIPLSLTIYLTSLRFVHHLKLESTEFYTELLKQVAGNIDFVYEQYAQTFSNIATRSELIEALNSPQYKTKSEEFESSRYLLSGGSGNVNIGVSKTLEEKMSGAAIICELDRKSLKDKSDYKVHFTSESSQNIIIENLLNDPFFNRTRDNASIKMILGRISDNIIMDGQKGIRSGFLFPITVGKEKDEKRLKPFDKFIFVALYKMFMPGFYESITKLKFGTLYILDRFDQVMTQSHPDDYNDYYEYDYESRKYILSEGDDPDDPYEIMSFAEYNKLNTNKTILGNNEVKSAINQLIYEYHNQSNDELQNKTKITQIEYNNTNYLLITAHSKMSEVNLVFFLPVSHIMKPIINFIKIIILITFIITLIIIAISYFFSRIFTDPIKQLSLASKEFAGGDYSLQLKIKSNNEIGDLADNFNKMVRDIKAYQDQLLNQEREKSEMEIAANIQASLAPDIKENNSYEITAEMIPSSEVGGDYYDIIYNKEESLWIGIGDVSGHGLASGLISMMVQNVFNGILLTHPDITPSDLLKEINTFAYHNIRERLKSDHFMTISFMNFSANGTVKSIGAHLDILVYRYESKKVEIIKTDGIWLGIIPEYESVGIEQTFNMNKNDTLLLYTDGLIEVMNDKSEQYDMKRLISRFEKSGEKNIDNIKSDILQDVYNFMKKQVDDITIMIIRKK